MISKTVLPFADLLGSEVLEKRTHFIELHETYIRWVYEAWVNYREEDGDPWYERLLSYDYKVKRSCVSMIELCYVEKPAYWKVVVWIQGTERDINIYFKKESNARELYDMLSNYIFEK